MIKFFTNRRFVNRLQNHVVPIVTCCRSLTIDRCLAVFHRDFVINVLINGDCFCAANRHFKGIAFDFVRIDVPVAKDFSCFRWLMRQGDRRTRNCVFRFRRSTLHCYIIKNIIVCCSDFNIPCRHNKAVIDVKIFASDWFAIHQPAAELLASRRRSNCK